VEHSAAPAPVATAILYAIGFGAEAITFLRGLFN
jgi:hypothetical protein